MLTWEETTICKAILSGRTPGQIRDQTEGLVPARLRDLAVRLAGHPDLTVCVVTFDILPRLKAGDSSCYANGRSS